MRIAHLSDLHFGTLELPGIEKALLDIMAATAPDLVIVSGDFTQNARRSEFAQARRFLDSLQRPILSVPGNHDVPGFSLVQRLLQPWTRYREYINSDLEPVYENDALMVVGLNSARAFVPHWNWANGALTGTQRNRVTDLFAGKKNKWCICVFHHPIHKADFMPIDVVVFGGKKMMKILLASEVDLVLTGHLHHASLTTHGNGTHSCVYLSAPSATSHRLRGEQTNGFNMITLGDMDMQVDMYAYDDGTYIVRETYKQRRSIAT